jgi:hypothetical protein
MKVNLVFTFLTKASRAVQINHFLMLKYKSPLLGNWLVIDFDSEIKISSLLGVA